MSEAEKNLRFYDFAYDPKCMELAMHFLGSDSEKLTEDEIKRFAQAIQDAAEDWIEAIGDLP